MITSPRNGGKMAKIYFPRERPLGHAQLSAAHLSSIIQTQKKDAFNQEMMELASKINEGNAFRPFLLSERPKSQQTSYRSQHVERSGSQEGRRSFGSAAAIKTRKGIDPSNFYLSDIAGEKWNELSRKSSKQVSKYLCSQSAKNNYNMRKYEFKSFLKDREATPAPPVAKEIKEVLYEKEKLNNWDETPPVIRSSRGAKISMRRKRMQSELQVMGSSFLARKEVQLLQIKV